MAAQTALRAANSAEFLNRINNVNICIGALIEHAHTWPSASLVASALAGVRDTLLNDRAVPSPSTTSNSPGDSLDLLLGLAAVPPSVSFENTGTQVCDEECLLFGLGESAEALSPWNNSTFTREFGVEAYLGPDWNVNECVTLLNHSFLRCRREFNLPNHPFTLQMESS